MANYGFGLLVLVIPTKFHICSISFGYRNLNSVARKGRLNPLEVWNPHAPARLDMLITLKKCDETKPMFLNCSTYKPSDLIAMSEKWNFTQAVRTKLIPFVRCASGKFWSIVGLYGVGCQLFESACLQTQADTGQPRRSRPVDVLNLRQYSSG